MIYLLNWITKHTTGGQYCAAPHHPFLKTASDDAGSNFINNLFDNRW